MHNGIGSSLLYSSVLSNINIPALSAPAFIALSQHLVFLTIGYLKHHRPGLPSHYVRKAFCCRGPLRAAGQGEWKVEHGSETSGTYQFVRDLNQACANS